MFKASLLIHLAKDSDSQGNSPSRQCNNQGRVKAIRLDKDEKVISLAKIGSRQFALSEILEAPDLPLETCNTKGALPFQSYSR